VAAVQAALEAEDLHLDQLELAPLLEHYLLPTEAQELLKVAPVVMSLAVMVQVLAVAVGQDINLTHHT
jgi:hypothetical protein